MAIYNVYELYNRICELANDGYEYVEIITLDSDEEFPESLSFNAIETYNSSVDYEEIESCVLSEHYCYEEKQSHTIKPTDYCMELNFTYNEIATIKHAVDNALEYFKEALKDDSYSKDIIKEIKESSIECRNLQAKLAHFLKHIH